MSVPTPYDKFSKKIDAKYVVAAVSEVLKVAEKYAIVVIESTISPGTIERSIRPLLSNMQREDVQLVHAPERIIPGNMVEELYHNNRTIGADSIETGEQIKRLYASFCLGGNCCNRYPDSRNDEGSREYLPGSQHSFCE